MELQLVKRDPYNSKSRWENWESNSKSLKLVSKDNLKLIKEFLEDMEMGKNVSPSAKKGERSFIRLNSLTNRMLFFGKSFDKRLDKITRDEVVKFFFNMRNGKIRKINDKPFKSVGTYVKDFKAFWHWLQRTRDIHEDITRDLVRTDSKPEWVYLTEEQFKKLANRSKVEYRALIWLMYDTGMRVTEAYSIKVKDFDKDFTQLVIRPEISKTIGRNINLKLSSSLIKDYIISNNLKRDDFIFLPKTTAFNMYLKRVSNKLFGDKESHPIARGNYKTFTLYDIRHNSSCFWLKRYKTLKGLMYRFGWMREDKIRYYSEFLGMSDELSDEDMVTSEDKSKLEKELFKVKRENEKLADKFDKLKEDIIKNAMRELNKKLKVSQ